MTKAKDFNNGRPDDNELSGLPLLYKRPVPLDSNRHKEAGIRPVSDYSFASDTNSLPLNTIELIEAAKNYPVVFTNNESVMPVAVVGLEQKNIFIKNNGSWQENSYIPAYVRQYPFIFFERKEENKFYLCVDELSPHFAEKPEDGVSRFYNDDGKPTEFTDNALKFCTAFYQHHLITRNFCADLQEHKLLQPYQSEVTLKTGQKKQLSGFNMINEKAFNELSDDVYLSFRKKGWIPFIYFMLASASNWKKIADLEVARAAH
ncbi:MAG: SapC family protein [Rickettsiales bacterium]